MPRSIVAPLRSSHVPISGVDVLIAPSMKTAMTIPSTALQLRSLIRKNGELELSLTTVPVPQPGADEVLVRVEAAPINPSDLGLLLGAADMSTAKTSGTADNLVVTATVPEHLMRGMA